MIEKFCAGFALIAFTILIFPYILGMLTAILWSITKVAIESFKFGWKMIR